MKGPVSVYWKIVCSLQ